MDDVVLQVDLCFQMFQQAHTQQGWYVRLEDGHGDDARRSPWRDGNQQSLKNFAWSTDARRNHRRDINFERLQSTALQSLLQALGGFGPNQILGCTNVQNGLSGWNGQERWTQRIFLQHLRNYLMERDGHKGES